MIVRTMKLFGYTCCDLYFRARWTGYHARRFAAGLAACLFTGLMLVAQVNPQVNYRDINKLEDQMKAVILAVDANQTAWLTLDKSLALHDMRIADNSEWNRLQAVRLDAQEALVNELLRKTDLGIWSIWLVGLLVGIIVKLPFENLRSFLPK